VVNQQSALTVSAQAVQLLAFAESIATAGFTTLNNSNILMKTALPTHH
jgi:hypothetical protein